MDITDLQLPPTPEEVGKALKVISDRIKNISSTDMDFEEYFATNKDDAELFKNRILHGGYNKDEYCKETK